MGKQFVRSTGQMPLFIPHGPGASRDAALHDQLFRYAEDMQVLMDSKNELEQRYRALRESHESVLAGRKVFAGLIQSCGRWQGQIINRKKSGELYTGWLAVTTAEDSEGKTLSDIGVFSDLSRLTEAEKRLFHLAPHDALTGLPSRQLLQDRMQQLISLNKHRGGNTLAIYHAD